MTERKAESEGLEFTGFYQGNYSDKMFDVVAIAKKIRKAGFRAVVATCDTGKSVYAEKAFINSELNKSGDLL